MLTAFSHFARLYLFKRFSWTLVQASSTSKHHHFLFPQHEAFCSQNKWESRNGPIQLSRKPRIQQRISSQCQCSHLMYRSPSLAPPILPQFHTQHWTVLVGSVTDIDHDLQSNSRSTDFLELKHSTFVLLQILRPLSDAEYPALTKMPTCRRPPHHRGFVQSRAEKSDFSDGMNRYRAFLQHCSSYYHTALLDIYQYQMTFSSS